LLGRISLKARPKGSGGYRKAGKEKLECSLKKGASSKLFPYWKRPGAYRTPFSRRREGKGEGDIYFFLGGKEV